MRFKRPYKVGIAIAAAGLLCVAALGPILDPEDPAPVTRQASPPVVGEFLTDGDYHLVTHPGRYGMGPERQGNRYAIVTGRLVRIDAATHKILSVLRDHVEILD